jgi:glutamate-5-semialdehyde dehydrogenase
MKCDLNKLGAKAKRASLQMAKATSQQKNLVLKNMAYGLLNQKEFILAVNQEDIEAAKATGLDAAMIDRLSLQGRLEGLAKDLLALVDLPDPVGEVYEASTLPNGLKLCKMRTPLGVLGVIYESRPNVTLDVAALTIKTGNCAILRGGSETLQTNLALMQVIHQALKAAELPQEAIQLIDEVDRGLVEKLLKLHTYVDLIIPRGGAGLHQFCRENSTIPVITGGVGVCHLYVDELANLAKAIEVIYNAKTQRPTVCNALDTVLIQESIAEIFLPRLMERLVQVEFRLDPGSWKIANQRRDALLYKMGQAQEQDWDQEWLSLILGVKLVRNLDEAIAHIQQHSTGHSDGILTEEAARAQTFVQAVDSAVVYVNASTRFTDGGQFGFGAEIAVSTQKLHARGPMGLRELTSYKWIVQGNYQIRGGS